MCWIVRLAWAVQILSADLTLRQHMENPSAGPLGKASWKVRKAADGVERGELTDHSKQKQLRQTLLQMATMFPVGFCLCAYPTYPIPYQLSLSILLVSGVNVEVNERDDLLGPLGLQ